MTLCTHSTDRQTGGSTDRQTDRQTDRTDGTVVVVVVTSVMVVRNGFISQSDVLLSPPIGRRGYLFSGTPAKKGAINRRERKKNRSIPNL